MIDAWCCLLMMSIVCERAGSRFVRGNEGTTLCTLDSGKPDENHASRQSTRGHCSTGRSRMVWFEKMTISISIGHGLSAAGVLVATWAGRDGGGGGGRGGRGSGGGWSRQRRHLGSHGACVIRSTTTVIGENRQDNAAADDDKLS